MNICVCHIQMRVYLKSSLNGVPVDEIRRRAIFRVDVNLRKPLASEEIHGQHGRVQATPHLSQADPGTSLEAQTFWKRHTVYEYV